MSGSVSTSATSSPYQLSRTSSQTSFETHQEEMLSAMQTTSPAPVHRVVFVGAGYVGGPTAAVIAYSCPQISVTVVDKSAQRIDQWKSKHLPIHEPGLKDIVRQAREGTDGPMSRSQNLFFSTDCDTHIAMADIIFLAVNTPTKVRGIGAGAATDISMFESAARSVALVAKPGAIIVEKSTVPCRTAEMVRDILSFHRPGVGFEVLSNPEFLAEGTAIRDLLQPSRILIGSSMTPQGELAAARVASVYENWIPKSSIITIDVWSSELAKLVANAMLAQRISSINTVSAICEKTGSNIDNVALAVGQDPRLGEKFLKSGLGFGGSCFKKDILSLSYLAESLDLPEVAHYWRQVVDINEWQCQRFVKGVLKTMNGSLRGKKVALLGYAFKKDTADTRESQATEVVRMLLQEGPAHIAIYDPQCNRQHIEQELTALLASPASIIQPHGPVSISDSPYEACATASAVLILTEWDQFRYPSIKHAKPTRPKPQYADSAVDCSFPTLQNMQDNACRDDARLHETSSTANLIAEPACPVDCRDCEVTAQRKDITNDALDWAAVAKVMQGERWVFDGRGVCDQAGLEKLGFLVRGIGRADSRSTLR
ncbi:Putative UDP-glucose/GDP-mannose dehydrogenase, NAD(P)-binding domain superfamily [Septoria linicola]|uniref:UDP-glucose 6-dehydrogenase n=1 Tax=Septoria linicola TaxID=215465 RepID=A0A9Q9EI18_9PEZI|nr:Putative UDP-glucose/GDP-mannose dehydrogenase, NAD(P)-binding domain superfamily [Septoria linicola]